MGVEAKFLRPDVMPDHIDPALITCGHQDHIALEVLPTPCGRAGTLVTPWCLRGSSAAPSPALYLTCRSLDMSAVEAHDFSEVEFADARFKVLLSDEEQYRALACGSPRFRRLVRYRSAPARRNATSISWPDMRHSIVNY